MWVDPPENPGARGASVCSALLQALLKHLLLGLGLPPARMGLKRLGNTPLYLIWHCD